MLMDLENFDVRAAVKRMEGCWNSGSGASAGAYAVLRFALLAEGEIQPDHLWKFDQDNRDAALGLLYYALFVGWDAVPAPDHLRSELAQPNQ